MGDSAGPANPTKPAVLIIGGLGACLTTSQRLKYTVYVLQHMDDCSAALSLS
jgi:hypothetical protein